MTEDKCLMTASGKHNYQLWSILWSKCKYCGKIVGTDTLPKKKKDDNKDT